MNAAAKPKKEAKPTTSVTVVRKMEEDWAGSRLSAFSKIGIAAPDRPAGAMLWQAGSPMLGQASDLDARIFWTFLERTEFAVGFLLYGFSLNLNST